VDTISARAFSENEIQGFPTSFELTQFFFTALSNSYPTRMKRILQASQRARILLSRSYPDRAKTVALELDVLPAT
jgi:hypothetical protein